MTVTIARVAAVVALILGIALGVQTCRVNRAHDRDVKARAEAQGKVLVDAGWIKTETAHTKELERLVPSLQAELAAAKTAKATIAGTSHWTGTGKEVEIPCTVVMGPQARTDYPQPGLPPVGAPGAPPSVAVTPHVRIDDAVALDDAGGIFVARKVQARLSVGESWASEWADVTPDAGSTTAVSPEVEAAWRVYRHPPPRVSLLPRGIKQWRAGWSCGVGAGYGVIGSRAEIVAACLWGVEF